MIRAAAVALIAAGAVCAQTAGTRAVVIADTAPVYAKMNAEGAPVATLERGVPVVIGMVLFGDETTWCLIQKPGETKRMGYVSCELVGPEKAPPPAPGPPASAPAEAPAAATVPTAAVPVPVPAATVPVPASAAPPPKPKPKPVVRELPQAPLRMREVTPADLARAAEPPAVAPARIAEAPKVIEPPAAIPPPPRTLGLWAIDDSGLSSLLASYVRSTSIISFLDKSRLEEIEATLLQQLIGKHFMAAAFPRAIAAQLAADPESMHAGAVSRWIAGPGSPAGQLLRHATRPAARPELVAYAGKMRQSPPAAARLELIHRLWDATRSSDAEVDATMILVRSTALALNPILPEAKRFTEPALDDALGKVREQYKPVMKNARVVLYLFAFDSLPDADLEAYVAFWEGPAGQWFAGRTRDGIAASARAIARNLSADIGRRAH